MYFFSKDNIFNSALFVRKNNWIKYIVMYLPCAILTERKHFHLIGWGWLLSPHFSASLCNKSKRCSAKKTMKYVERQKQKNKLFAIFPELTQLPFPRSLQELESGIKWQMRIAPMGHSLILWIWNGVNSIYGKTHHIGTQELVLPCQLKLGCQKD